MTDLYVESCELKYSSTAFPISHPHQIVLNTKHFRCYEPHVYPKSDQRKATSEILEE